MKFVWWTALSLSLAVWVLPAAAQTPLAANGEQVIDATAGNQVLQVRYL